MHVTEPRQGDSGRPTATPWLRRIAALAAALACLPVLTFACAIIVNGFGRDVVGIVLDVGLAILAIDAVALVFAILVCTVRVRRPGRLRGRGGR